MIFNFCPKCGYKCCKKDHKLYFCSKCHSHWFNQPTISAAAFIADNKGRYLFTKRSYNPYKNSLTIPGGFIDNGESTEMGLRREIKEEVGLEVEKLTYFSSYPTVYPYKGNSYPVVVEIFSTAIYDKTAHADYREVAKIYWLKPDQINLNKIKLPDIKKATREYFSSL